MQDHLSDTLAALADPTRREIVDVLTKGPANVSDFVERFHLAQPTISKHLKVLEAAGLISRGKVGQTRPCRLETQNLKGLETWLRDLRFEWESRMDRFQGFVDKEEREISDD